MATNSNLTPGFEPLHKGHAIEQMVLTVQMNREIDDTSIADIKKTFSTPPELGKRQELRGFMFAIGNVPTPRASPAAAAGYTYSKLSGDGSVETELRVERMAITFTTTRYTAWVNIWTQVRQYIETLLPYYVPNVMLSAIALTYVDRFVWNRPDLKANPTHMLRPNSRFLCPNVYSALDLWHSHTGWFDQIDAATKRLLNANVDFVDQEKDDELRKAIVIRTVLTDFLNQPDYERTDLKPDNALSFIESHLNQLHDHCKWVLSQILSDEMSNRIALDAKKLS